MQEILSRLNDLRTLSGNAQISYLNSVKTDLLKEILEYTYDTHRKYKIDEGKYDKVLVEACELEQRETLTIEAWNKFKELLDYLSEIKSAKDTDVEKVKQFIETYKEHDFLKMILFKDLRLNMNNKKFQKVWPDFLVEPQVQLAQKFEGQIFTNPRYSRKLDGLRCYYLNGKAISRTNKPHNPEPLKHITEQLEKNLLTLNDMVLDGEIIYLNPDGTEDFKKAISLVRSETRTEDCNNLYYVVFDYINKDNFLSKEPSIPFIEADKYLKTRLGITDENVWMYKTNLPNVLINKQVDENGLDALREARKANSWEGIMLRDGDAPYEYKRTNKLLKIKEMQDLEVKLIGMEPGTGKHEGKLGAFVADYNGFPLKIGSGFSDEQREKYWNNKNSYIDKWVKVQYFEKTTNAQGGESLRFPIFICFRDPITMEEFV